MPPTLHKPDRAAPRDRLAHALAAYAPVLLDASARGSGWNSVWRIELDGTPHVLKCYGRRRARGREWLTDLAHRLGGRTPFTAAARRETEARGLRLWRQAGFDVPALFDPPPEFPPLPVPFLLMEFLPGPTLARALADPDAPAATREALLRRFAAAWGTRHTAAVERREPALLQEHPALEHVLVSGARLVTFDLEVAYTNREAVPDAVAAEIAGFVRSLVKGVSREEAPRLLRLLVGAYPDRSRLAGVYTSLHANAAPLRRLLHALDRLLLRKAGRLDKYAAARLLRDALNG